MNAINQSKRFYIKLLANTTRNFLLMWHNMAKTCLNMFGPNLKNISNAAVLSMAFCAYAAKVATMNSWLHLVASAEDFALAVAQDEWQKAPVRACHRYLSNRVTQFDYKSAIEQGLPIGSGEVESAHRYVIQKRLKISGAWWKGDNTDYMLALRIMRANDEWGAYGKTAA